jgi:NodT family efflux transporter outer membrane factor (OMF) lipoprotein
MARRMLSRRSSVPSQFTNLVLPLFALFGLGSCRSEPRAPAPPVSVPDEFTTKGELALPVEWWMSFDDPRLSRLVGIALESNLELRGAWDRLARAEAVAAREGADLQPSLNYSAGAGTSWSRRELADGSFSTDRADDFSLGLAASFEVDLWGGLESAVQAARLDVLASAEDLQAAAITLSATVATVWYALVAENGKLDLLKRQQETNRQVLELVTLRFRMSRAGAADVLRQRQLIESLQGEIERVDGRARVLEHQLAILLGRPPTESVAPRTAELITLPPLPDTGLPIELLQRRPDVKNAYYRVMAADRRVAVAVADRFPRLTLSARALTSTDHAGDLFQSWLAGLGADLVGPIFDGGRRDAEVDRTRAVLSESLHDYGQVILDSLGEVEDALVIERKQRDLILSLQRQLELSDQVIERIRESYTKGAVDYLRVLETLSTNQALQRNVLEAERQLIEYRIDLCRALAGGWEMSRPELADLDEETTEERDEKPDVGTETSDG